MDVERRMRTRTCPRRPGKASGRSDAAGLPAEAASSEAREREGGSNSVVESQPSKLLVAGSIPVSRSSLRSRLRGELRLGKPARRLSRQAATVDAMRRSAADLSATRATKRAKADVAQLAERVLGKDEVTGSILVIGSSLRSRMREATWRRQGEAAARCDEWTTKAVTTYETTTAKRGLQRHGKREIRSFETARQRRHHRPHRPREDDADRGADEGGGGQGLGEVHPVRRGGEGVRVAGPSRRDEDPDDRDEPRRVRDAEPALRARRLPGPRRLHQEHDHRRGADGRRDPGGQRGRRPDAADARARAARQAGQRAVHGGRAEQGGRGRRPGAARPRRARGARAAQDLRLPGRRRAGGAGVGAEGAAGRPGGRASRCSS